MVKISIVVASAPNGNIEPIMEEIGPPYGQKIETIVESGNCLGREVALRVVLRYS